MLDVAYRPQIGEPCFRQQWGEYLPELEVYVTLPQVFVYSIVCFFKSVIYCFIFIIAFLPRSFFQSVCVLGYCMFPLVTSLLFCWLIIKLAPENLGFFIVRFVIVALGYGWSIFGKNRQCLFQQLGIVYYLILIMSSFTASIAFLGDSQPPKRKALAVYPICLFYMALAWMIITLTQHSSIKFHSIVVKVVMKTMGMQILCLRTKFSSEYRCWTSFK